jgi:hypothetical protein
VFALLADGRLLTVRTADGSIVVDEPLLLAPPATSATDVPTSLFPAHYLALSRDGRHLFALVPSDNPGSGRLAVIDTSTSAIEAIYTPDASDIVYRSLAVGITTGRLYLFGNRDKSAVVTVLNGPDGSTVATWSARGSDDYNWLVYQGAVTSDEQQLFISYHGQDTTGVDWFDVTPSGLEGCPQNRFGQHLGCLGGHGSFTLYHGDILVATGLNVIEQVDMQGKVKGAWDTGLNNNHLMEFVADETAGKLYAAGPCGYVGGLGSANLRGAGVLTTPTVPGESSWLVTPQLAVLLVPPPSSLCGDRLALVHAAGVSLLVIGQTVPLGSAPGTAGALLFVEARTGQIVRTVPIDSEPFDVLSFP